MSKRESANKEEEVIVSCVIGDVEVSETKQRMLFFRGLLCTLRRMKGEQHTHRDITEFIDQSTTMTSNTKTQLKRVVMDLVIEIKQDEHRKREAAREHLLFTREVAWELSKIKERNPHPSKLVYPTQSIHRLMARGFYLFDANVKQSTV